jgi:hypothetical protein
MKGYSSLFSKRYKYYKIQVTFNKVQNDLDLFIQDNNTRQAIFLFYLHLIDS